ncbi:MAG: SurA N-terminal domain-containing protein [Ginsengibacter sp.]
MSIIQTIREKGAVITISVLAIALIGFMLMDSGRTGMFGSQPQFIGEINGEEISIQEFNAKVSQIEQQYPNNGSAQRNQIMEGVWDQLVAEKIVEEQFTKLGITFTANEMSSIMFSNDAPPQLKQAFTNPETGQYDIEQAKQWWMTTKSNKNEEQRKAIISQVIDPMRLNSMYTKYTSMIAASVYQPKWMTKVEQQENTEAAVISYVAIPYHSISDSAVKVTDNDIKDYLNKYKARFEQEGGRMVSYVSFSASANSEDSARIKNMLLDLKPSFAVDSNAKLFLGKHASAIPLFDGFTPADKMQMPYSDSIKSLPVGGVFGPYEDGSNYVIAKKVSSKLLPDSIKARHILIGTIDPQSGQPKMEDSAAETLADSIAKAIAGGASFNELEQKYSTDEAAKLENGVMTFDIMTIQGDGFAKEFADFLLNERGETKKVVKTQFGYHYIEILNKINPKPAYKIAFMARDIAPSDETINAANTAAIKLAGSAADVKSFHKYAQENGLTVIDIPNVVKENDYQLGGLDDARSIVKWAFEAKEGEVSTPFTIKDDFVVAILDRKVKAGVPDVATARPMVEATIRNNKKAEEIKKKLKDVSTLEAAAAAFNVSVLTTGEDSTFTFNSQIINGIGNEPRVAGAAFNKAFQSKISGPIKGNTGVFVLKVNNVFKIEGLPVEILEQQQKAQMNGRVQSALGQSFESLKKIADIKDNRSSFF